MNYIWMYNTAFCSLVLKRLGTRLCILLLHHFCASSNIRTVHALLLEYAFYPIFPYVCIKLHDNNFRPVVWLYMAAISQTFCLHQEAIGLQSTIITTFPLLSFSKVIIICLLYTFQFQRNYHDKQRNCVLIQQLSAIFIGVVHIWSYSCVYVGSIYNQFFSFCTPQDCLEGVSHAVNFAGGMLFTCL